MKIHLEPVKSFAKFLLGFRSIRIVSYLIYSLIIIKETQCEKSTHCDSIEKLLTFSIVFLIIILEHKSVLLGFPSS